MVWHEIPFWEEERRKKERECSSGSRQGVTDQKEREGVIWWSEQLGETKGAIASFKRRGKKEKKRLGQEGKRKRDASQYVDPVRKL